MSPRFLLRYPVVAASLAGSLALTACSWGYKPPPPTPLQANPATAPASLAWRGSMGGSVTVPMQMAVQANQVLVADVQGNVQALDSSSGIPLWTLPIGQPLSAGIGFDGNTAAVITAKSELLTIRNGAILWRGPLQNPSHTTPLVAGGRVFVLGSDHSVHAHDGNNGYLLWGQKSQAPENRLVLTQPFLLMPAGGALFAGVAGSIVGFNPDNGNILAETTLANPRGVTELSQVVNVLMPASRIGDSLCARAYQATVGCTNLANGTLQWVQPHVGSTGVSGNAQIVVGADNDDVLTAWSRQDGKVLWKNETFKHRNLSAPLVAGDSIVIGDSQGYVHILSASNGTLRNRVRIDESPIQTAPVLAGNTVVIATSKGTVAGLNLQ